MHTVEDTDRPRVVVGVDGSPGSRVALAWALESAARRGAALQVVAAYPVDLYWADAHLLDRGRLDLLREDTGARARELVTAAQRDPRSAGVAAVPVEVLAVPGAPAEQLVRLSEGAEQLVVGSRGRGGLRSTLLGSVALHCSAHARCPVVVVHPATAPTAGPPRVVVGVDGSAPARAALAEAARAAAELDATLEVVTAFHLPVLWTDLSVLVVESQDEFRDEALRRARDVVDDVLGADPPVPVQVLAEEGRATDVLVTRAAGATLLVVGSRSRSRLPGMVLGSVALHAVVHAPCPVQVVHPAGAHDGAAGARRLAAGAS
ncbi:universal stress protein [Modestobacter roseus]|uniref:universal stress protein n=1 Tax=Modestobacter roseus TaxID=1181884 RepID=UPI0034DF5A75